MSQMKEQEVREAFDEIMTLEDERSTTNAAITKVRKTLRAEGFTTKAINDQLQFLKADAKQRVKEDGARARLRQIYGFPLAIVSENEMDPVPDEAASASGGDEGEASTAASL